MAAGAIKAVSLAVSGAFHTSLMQPAREALEEVGWDLLVVGQFEGLCEGLVGCNGQVR